MTGKRSDDMPEVSIGPHTTTSGEKAIITSIGADSRLHGYVPGHLTSTWWHPSGRHNLFRNFDLVRSDASTSSRRASTA